ncbi:unnamed protein product [Pleuronectes platessa]|uniref:Uncharacterized protein n=1 Tax=Pleuronectes platessa TaxID=8262 RepID=A0A9N7UNX9_PLEPL|nr:unnamed protein product [Pleuronectes platessa]
MNGNQCLPRPWDSDWPLNAALLLRSVNAARSVEVIHGNSGAATERESDRHALSPRTRTRNAPSRTRGQPLTHPGIKVTDRAGGGGEPTSEETAVRETAAHRRQVTEPQLGNRRDEAHRRARGLAAERPA